MSDRRPGRPMSRTEPSCVRKFDDNLDVVWSRFQGSFQRSSGTRRVISRLSHFRSARASAADANSWWRRLAFTVPNIT